MPRNLPDPDLDFLCIQQSNTAPFCENYAKLFLCKTLKKDGIEAGEIFGTLFGQYQMLP